MIEKEAEGTGKSRVKPMKEAYQKVFDIIQNLLAFDDLDKKFIEQSKYGNDYKSEYNLFCPTSKAVFLILWLYSVEPPLYFHFNTACRDRNNALLPLLGPFAKATGVILEGVAERDRGDGFKIGGDIDRYGFEPLGKMAGAFVVFRGAQLPLHVVNRYALLKGRRWFNQTQMVNGVLKGRTNLNEG